MKLQNYANYIFKIFVMNVNMDIILTNIPTSVNLIVEMEL